jgi:hypothetical protein
MNLFLVNGGFASLGKQYADSLRSMEDSLEIF